MASSRPSEHSEQVLVVRKMKSANVWFCAVPNGGKRHREEAIRLTQEGVRKGAPDLLIFDPPPNHPDKVGVALEMKRQGCDESSLGRNQVKWLAALEERGWLTLVGYGARDALIKLQEAGYPVKPPKPPKLLRRVLERHKRMLEAEGYTDDDFL